MASQHVKTEVNEAASTGTPTNTDLVNAATNVLKRLQDTAEASSKNSDTGSVITGEQSAIRVIEKVDTGEDEIGIKDQSTSKNAVHDQSTTSNMVNDQSTTSYVIIYDNEDGEPFELPLEPDGSLAVTTLQIEFTGAQGLKYRNPSSGIMRILKADDDAKIRSPSEGWKCARFIACVPKGSLKRPWNEEEANNGDVVDNKPKQISATPVSQQPSLMIQPPIRTGGQFPIGPRAPPSLSVTRPRFPAPTANSQPQKHTPSKPHDFCAVCSVALNSESQAQLHYSGKKHLDKVAKKAKNPTAVGLSSANRGGIRGRGSPRRNPLLVASLGTTSASRSRRWTPMQFSATGSQDFTQDSNGYPSYSAAWTPK